MAGTHGAQGRALGRGGPGDAAPPPAPGARRAGSGRPPPDLLPKLGCSTKSCRSLRLARGRKGGTEAKWGGETQRPLKGSGRALGVPSELAASPPSAAATIDLRRSFSGRLRALCA